MANEYIDFMGTIYPSYSGYQTVYGYGDYVGDPDYAQLTLSSSGYYNITSTGNVVAGVYDATVGSYVYGASYQTDLYLDAFHTNYVYTYDYTSGEYYSVTVTPILPGETIDNMGNLYPNVSGYGTVYGYGDYYSDADYATLYLSSSGYYDLASTGNVAAYVYDATTNTYVYGSSYQTDLYLNQTHTNYVFAYDYTSGEYYSVSVTAKRMGEIIDNMGTISMSSGDSQTVYGYGDFYEDRDYAVLDIDCSGYYNISSSGDTGVYVYDASASTWWEGSNYQNWVRGETYETNLYLNASHTNYVYAFDYAVGDYYSVTVSLAYAESNNWFW